MEFKILLSAHKRAFSLYRLYLKKSIKNFSTKLQLVSLIGFLSLFFLQNSFAGQSSIDSNNLTFYEIIVNNIGNIIALCSFVLGVIMAAIQYSMIIFISTIGLCGVALISNTFFKAISSALI